MAEGEITLKLEIGPMNEGRVLLAARNLRHEISGEIEAWAALDAARTACEQAIQQRRDAETAVTIQQSAVVEARDRLEEATRGIDTVPTPGVVFASGVSFSKRAT